MKYHPIQGDQEKLKKISELFKQSMDNKKVRPVNPWKAKRLETWLGKMGARFQPETFSYRPYRLDTQNYVNFKVECHGPRGSGRIFARRRKIRGRDEARWVRIEIPWELADKILVLGYLP